MIETTTTIFPKIHLYLAKSCASANRILLGLGSTLGSFLILLDLKNPAWRWVFGIIAAYGIRPHEIFHLDVGSLKDYPPILRVGNQTKTYNRLVYPIPNHRWIISWSLENKQLPNIRTTGKSNKELGGKIASGFSQRNIPSPYHFRDAYAIRGVIYNFNPANVAKWMGHSLDTHEKKYLRHMQEKHFTESWCRNQLSES